MSSPDPAPRLLILNRRDPAHPLAGGAEIYLAEAARGMLDRGWRVDWLSSRFPGATEEETVGGLRILRRGTEASTHLHGRRFARARGGDYTRVLDCFNGIGYGAGRSPNGALMIFQLYGREFWTAEFGVWGHGAAALETRMLRRYRGSRILTISESTCRDLDALGLTGATVVPVGLNRPPLPAPPPLPEPLTVVYAGRLRATKNPEDALRAFGHIRETCPEARMIVIGRGPEEERLRRRHASPAVQFTGYVTEEEKFRLLADAHLVLIPSLREGWNMVVTEAASVATPASATARPAWWTPCAMVKPACSYRPVTSKPWRAPPSTSSATPTATRGSAASASPGRERSRGTALAPSLPTRCNNPDPKLVFLVVSRPGERNVLFKGCVATARSPTHATGTTFWRNPYYTPSKSCFFSTFINPYYSQIVPYKGKAASSRRTPKSPSCGDTGDHPRGRPPMNRPPRGFPRCGRTRKLQGAPRAASGCMRAVRQVAPAAGVRAGAFETGSRARRGGRRWTPVRAVPPQHRPRPGIGRDPHGLPLRAEDG
jgi:glycosyltransferase involved in cell wall biosynthesis